MQQKNGELSPQQVKLMQFLKDYREAHHYAPGIREFAEALGVSSTSVVNYHLSPLVASGYVDGRRTDKNQIAPNTWHLTELGLNYLKGE